MRKALKVNSPGSYLDGMVLFYYATSDVKQDCLGRLSIVGDQDDQDVYRDRLDDDMIRTDENDGILAEARTSDIAFYSQAGTSTGSAFVLNGVTVASA